MRAKEKGENKVDRLEEISCSLFGLLVLLQHKTKRLVQTPACFFSFSCCFDAITYMPSSTKKNKREENRESVGIIGNFFVFFSFRFAWMREWKFSVSSFESGGEVRERERRDVKQ